jgi:hypothetical protein
MSDPRASEPFEDARHRDYGARPVEEREPVHARAADPYDDLDDVWIESLRLTTTLFAGRGPVVLMTDPGARQGFIRTALWFYENLPLDPAQVETAMREGGR